MNLFNYLTHFLSDLNNWVFGIFIGVLGKISYELYMKRTITVIQWIAVIGLSITLIPVTVRVSRCDNA